MIFNLESTKLIRGQLTESKYKTRVILMGFPCIFALANEQVTIGQDTFVVYYTHLARSRAGSTDATIQRRSARRITTYANRGSLETQPLVALVSGWTDRRGSSPAHHPAWDDAVVQVRKILVKRRVRRESATWGYRWCGLHY